VAASAARGGMAGRKAVGCNRRLDLKAGSRFGLNVAEKHVADPDRRRRVAPARPRSTGSEKYQFGRQKGSEMHAAVEVLGPLGCSLVWYLFEVEGLGGGDVVP
jgi:hypothetical protein